MFSQIFWLIPVPYLFPPPAPIFNTFLSNINMLFLNLPSSSFPSLILDFNFWGNILKQSKKFGIRKTFENDFISNIKSKNPTWREARG